MRAYVGVTDWDWYRFLRARGASEVNFWQPSGGRRFAAVPQGAPFLFKTHYSHGNRIVGGGFLSGWASLPMSRAWEFFGPDNGCADYVRYFHPDDAPAAPPGWSGNIVQGRSYDLASPEGSYIEDVLATLLRTHAAGDPEGGAVPTVVPGEVFGTPRLTPVRVGQAAFKALVQEAYGRRCAITGDKIVPVLQAAHIRPVTDHGENRVDNGLLLRSDVHTLFDQGYLGVHPDRRSLMVSPRLRADWANGEQFYRQAATGQPITLPARRADRPNHDFLTWHADTCFLAS